MVQKNIDVKEKKLFIVQYVLTLQLVNSFISQYLFIIRPTKKHKNFFHIITCLYNSI